MAKALRNALMTPTPQTEQDRPDQVKNNAGGFVFEVTDEKRLNRFLSLGVDGGTFYVQELRLGKDTVRWLEGLIARNEEMVLRKTIEISEAGRAYRNDQAVFVLALLLHKGQNKQAARAAVPKVVRTAYHAFQLAEYIEAMGAGWGQAKMKAFRGVGDWFSAQSAERLAAEAVGWFGSKTADELAYQAVKYRSRKVVEGESFGPWTLGDLMRLSHPRNVDPLVGAFILNQSARQRGKPWQPKDYGKTFPASGERPSILDGFEKMQKTTSAHRVVEVLNEYPNLPWETVPTQFHKDLKVWQTLFENGQLRGQALLRNITRLARLKAFSDLGFARKVADELTNEEMIAKTRLHPMQYLNAMVVYTEGQGKQVGQNFIRQPREWTTAGIITDALDNGYGLSFGNVEPAGKRTKIVVDSSGSMFSWWQAGSTQLSAMEAAVAMGLITARTEPMYEFGAVSHYYQDVGISASDTLTSAMYKMRRIGGGGTDLAAVIQHAAQHRQEIDTFEIITDTETWNGGVHPYRALLDYRQKMGIPAKLVVMAMVATEFSIADPNDAGSLDVSGFDTDTPRAVADFSAGRV